MREGSTCPPSPPEGVVGARRAVAVHAASLLMADPQRCPLDLVLRQLPWLLGEAVAGGWLGEAVAGGWLGEAAAGGWLGEAVAGGWLGGRGG